MFVKIHKSYREVVAICDSDLIGKILEEGKFQLDVKENFYKGKEVTEEELVKIIQKMVVEDSTFNIVGKKSISIAKKIGLINQESVKEIAGTPFSLVLL